MKTQLCWLMLTVLFTALMWLPYVLNAIAKRGLLVVMGYDESVPALSDWAQRAKKAHANAVENLVLFVPSVLVFTHLAGDRGEAISCATATYFFARVAHFFCYTFKVPMLRTVSFFIGYFAQLWIIWQIFKLLCPKHV